MSARNEIAAILAEHATVNSTAAWVGTPDPGNPRNIRRVCRCGAVIGWHKPHNRPGIPEPLSGHPFDEPHRAHIAEVLSGAGLLSDARALGHDA